MNPNSDIKWNHCSIQTIELITQYTPFTNQLQLRLINKRWKSVVDSIIFHELPIHIKDEDLSIIERYSHYFRKSPNHDCKKSDINWRLEKFVSLREFVLYFHEFNLTDYQELFSNYKHKIRKLEFHITCFNQCDHNLNQFNDFLNNFNNLESLEINWMVNCRESMPQFYPWNNIRHLKFSCQDILTDRLLASIGQLPNLEDLDWRIIYHSRSENDSKRKSTLYHDMILDQSNLKRLSLSSICYDKYMKDPYEYMGDQLTKLFNHERFNKLQRLDWDLVSYRSNFNSTIFNDHLLGPSAPWNQLTHLNLPHIDTFLMTYIMQYCPNLTALAMKSPLVLPDCDTYLECPQLVRLRNLSCPHIDNQANNHPEILHHLFPNLVNFFLYQPHPQYVFPTNDAPCCVPKAFPNLKFMAFHNAKIEIEDLINDTDLDVRWESVYLKCTDAEVPLYQQLIPKLKWLKFLYLHQPWGQEYSFDFEQRDIKVFTTSSIGRLDFEMKIGKQLQ